MPRDLPNFDLRGPRIIGPREQDIVEDMLRIFSQMMTQRATFGAHWEEIAQLIDPFSKNTFQYGNFNWPGQKKSERQIDATGMMALKRFGAICDSMLTPHNQFWHGVAASNEYVMKQRDVKLYFEQVTKILFRLRYRPSANFSAQNQGIYRHLGAYGTGALFIDELDTELGDHLPGFRYKNIPLGQMFIQENHQGVPNGYIRWFRMTAQQAWERKEWQANYPEVLIPALKANSVTMFDFLHCVVPRTQYDFDPERLDARGKRFASYYISMNGKSLLSEGGYNSLPAVITRYEQTPDDGPYGRSIAMAVLPALKTLNAEKATFLKAGHRAADPVLFTSDDGVIDASMRPGALNKGGVNAEGRLMVQPLPIGEVQISKEMMEDERNLINDGFLVRLFQILEETPQMTATEVIERVNEKGILIAPDMGRQHAEYVGPMVEREVQIASQLGLLPPMPPVLREARGEYHVTYTNPLSRAMRAGEAAGFMRAVEVAKEITNITQDPSYLDTFDFDVAMPAIAEIQSVPASWMASAEKIAQKRQQRAKAMERQQQIQAAPAQAAMMKAQAAQAKAGMGPGQAPAQGGPPLQQQVAG